MILKHQHNRNTIYYEYIVNYQNQICEELCWCQYRLLPAHFGDLQWGLSPRARGTHLRWTDGFTQLARDTTLLSRRVASQTVLPTEAWTERPLLKGVVKCSGLLEQHAQGDTQTCNPLYVGEDVSSAIPPGLLTTAITHILLNRMFVHQMVLTLVTSHEIESYRQFSSKRVVKHLNKIHIYYIQTYEINGQSIGYNSIMAVWMVVCTLNTSLIWLITAYYIIVYSTLQQTFK